jgi:LAO/AO transport system kinase
MRRDVDRMALLHRAREGHVPSMACLISLLESRATGYEVVLPELHAAGGHAHIVGVTGPPGSGKSSLVNALITEARSRGTTVAVIAIDPSSSVSGGAILGDRIRMLEHGLDRGVFVRSMSTRGTVGGVSRATVDAVAVLDASGWDTVIVETIGAGQDEIDIIRVAHTTVLVSAPGLGDDIQAIKAGLLEVADVHVVNKADRPDAHKTASELVGMLMLHPPNSEAWAVPVLSTVALDGTGVADLIDTIDAHRIWLRDSGELAQRERAAAAARIRAIAKDLLLERIGDPAAGPLFDELVESVATRRVDPESAAALLLTNAAQADLYLEKTT